MAAQVNVPKDLVWDHREAPASLQWRLQRLADFFPRYGRDRTTVALLYLHRHELTLDPGTRALIEEYERAHEEREQLR
jgi:hypothetical protein